MKHGFYKQVYDASVMGLSCVVNILVGACIGYWLDTYFATTLWFFIFLGFGIVAGLRSLYRDAKRLLRSIDEKH